MAHPLVWPKKAFFYPIGNTPPICLTQDLSPEKSADILLLGCGDPRSILFTVFNDPAPRYRSLDVSCCDWEPAVLARNVILLTMAADGVATTSMWSIFYHFFLDKKDFDALLAQCRTLMQASVDMKTWKSSKYGNYIRFSTDHTLLEIRRHWKLYLGFEDLSDAEKKSIRSSFTTGMEKVREKFKGTQVISGVRSAGPLFLSFMQHASKSFHSFWSTGTTSSDNKATPYTNPTFLYSLSGNVFNVHYGTDPLLAFHVAPALISIKGQDVSSKPSLKDFVNVAKGQFQQWCFAFQERTSAGSAANLKIRFHVGESLAFCRLLLFRQRHGVTEAGVYTAPWGGTQIALDEEDYSQDISSAPLAFNIIETSNLTDHLGLLNLLSATVPLLQRNPWSVLYTNTLVQVDPNDLSTSNLASRIGVDVPTVSLMFGVTPSSCLSHFTTHSNKHELLAACLGSTQMHEYIAWKIPTSTIPGSAAEQDLNTRSIQVWDSKDLGKVLFSFYLWMFEDENLSLLTRNMSLSRLERQSSCHHVRESLVSLFSIAKETAQVEWEKTIETFLDLISSDRTLLIGLNSYQDLICQLYLRDLYTVDTMKPDFLQTLRKPGDLFEGWKDVPPVVCVVLKVPRSSLKVLEDMDPDVIQTPFLQCETRSAGFQNMFSSIRPVFGKVVTSAAADNQQISIIEDALGFDGDSPLIVTFYMPTWVLLKSPPDAIEIGLLIKHTAAAMMSLSSKLGFGLGIYSSKVSNSNNVQITRHRPNNLKEFEYLRRGSGIPKVTPASEIRRKVAVGVDAAGTKATSLTLRADITDLAAKKSLGSGASVTTKAVGDGIVSVVFPEYKQNFVYPIPIRIDQLKVRIARKSLYIEIEAPLRLDFEDSRVLSLSPFPIVVAEKTTNLLNMHYINLDKLPALSLPKTEKKSDWLSTHMGLSLSEGERRQKESPNQEQRGAIVNLKESISAIFFHHMDSLERPRVFALSNKPGVGIYTLLFLNDIKLDLSAYTVVADACVVPLYENLLSKLWPSLGKLSLIEIFTLDDEVLLWKMMLPAAAERCRTWKHTRHCEYLKKGIPAVLEGYDASPLCSCGKGKNLGSFGTVAEWKPFFKDATRVAISPLFTFSMITKFVASMKDAMSSGDSDVASSPNVSSLNLEKCANCGGPGSPALQICSSCKKVKYCSRNCQKSHWKTHKPHCDPK